MNTTPYNAVDRPVRDGRGHLTLVPQEAPAAPTGDNSNQEPAAPKAERLRMVPLPGSATMRALIALGALASAFGFSVGRAEAVFGSPDAPIEQADPSDALIPEASMPAATATHHATTDAPKVKAAVSTGTVVNAEPVVAAGKWAPATRHPVQVTYKALDPGPGRHRKPHTERPTGGSPVGGPGRHRRTNGAGHNSRHSGTMSESAKSGAPGSHSHGCEHNHHEHHHHADLTSAV
ncbi:hypothetical protein ACIA7S_28215 [Streptomyces sp. NPDC051643]|uniref:hypothetical protein n=1 Tax=Streptomyces sp. NPDC051643 TaxID=3365665 RepID=UPI0037A9303E